MTVDDVLATLRLECAPAEWPTLSEDDLAAIAAGSRRADRAGLGVTDPAWTPTFDVAWACAKAWEVKAGRAAGAFDFAADRSTFNRSQVAAACRAQAATYRRRIETAPLTDESPEAAVGYAWPWTVF